MTLTVEISSELESMLETEAERNGVSKDEFVKGVLEEKLVPQRKRQIHGRGSMGSVVAKGLPIRDRSLEYEWILKHRDEYDGQYVALQGDELIAADKSAKTVAAKAREIGIKEALIVYVEGSGSQRFIGGGVW